MIFVVVSDVSLNCDESDDFPFIVVFALSEFTFYSHRQSRCQSATE